MQHKHAVPLIGFIAMLGACATSHGTVQTNLSRVNQSMVRSLPGPTESLQVSHERPPGPLRRTEVQALVARGLGAFLSTIEVSPVLVGTRFVGFRLDAARDLPAWQASGADMHTGDVILRVNGIRIERPEQALWAFEQLRVAPAIEVEVLRNGAHVTVRSPIVNDPTPTNGQ